MAMHMTCTVFGDVLLEVHGREDELPFGGTRVSDATTTTIAS